MGGVQQAGGAVKMLLRRGARAAGQSTRVWLLGCTHPNADRSIDWDDDPFSNLSDPDALVVDLATLTVQVLERIGKTKLDQARELIRDKILNRETVIVITQPLFWADPPLTPNKNRLSTPDLSARNSRTYSNYEIFPTQLATKNVPDGEAIEVVDKHDFKKYMDNVHKFSLYITDYSPRAVSGRLGSSINIELTPVRGQGIRDNFDHALGLTLTAVVVNHYDSTYNPYENAGRLVFLPPLTEPTGVAIGRILSAYGKSTPHAEAPPTWAERLSIGLAGKHQERIIKLEERKAIIQGEIDGLARLNDRILAHCRLLYLDGTELEDAIVQAFRILGFDDIEQMGKADEEDAAFAMDGTGYLRGVVEAKGAGRGLQLQHILQCNRWTDRRAIADGGLSKGIFVPNQHRLEPYPESAEVGMKIEPNHLEQAEMKDICIIPSCALFEAVSRVLGGGAPDRERIGGKIADSKGVLRDVL